MKKHEGNCGSPICKECCDSDEKYQEKIKEYVKWLRMWWE